MRVGEGDMSVIATCLVSQGLLLGYEVSVPLYRAGAAQVANIYLRLN